MHPQISKAANWCCVFNFRCSDERNSGKICLVCTLQKNICLYFFFKGFHHLMRLHFLFAEHPQCPRRRRHLDSTAHGNGLRVVKSEKTQAPAQNNQYQSVGSFSAASNRCDSNVAMNAI